jgi:hypothetical protein
MLRHRLQSKDARGRVDGLGWRRRRISSRRFSSPSGGAGAGQEVVLSLRILDTWSAGVGEHRSLFEFTHVVLEVGSSLKQQQEHQHM